MSTTTFPRQSFTQLWLTLRSNEELGLLDSDYIEDFYGDDGYITLHHVDSSVEYQMAMLPLPGETLLVDNDVFQGTLPLAGMDNGLYEVRFRVRDPLGNYSISNSVQNPFGGERIISLNLNIVELVFGYVYQVGALIARGGYEVNLSRVDESVTITRFEPSVEVPRPHVYVEIT